MASTAKTIVLITGANTGLGYQMVRILYSNDKTPYEIILGSRNLENGQKTAKAVEAEFPQASLSHITPMQIDIEDDKSIENLYKDVQSKFGYIDVLVNNAGASFDIQLEQGKLTVREAWTKSWSVNVTSTHIMTDAFVPLLLKSKSPYLLFMASGTSSLDGSNLLQFPFNQSPEAGWPKKAAVHASGNILTYRAAKTGMNMMMRDWHRQLLNDGVKVFALSPGWLATGLAWNDPEKLKAGGAGDPEVAGHFVLEVLAGNHDADAGKVIRRSGVVQPW